nr:recombinase family protein [Changpingibacter yushuensis]
MTLLLPATPAEVEEAPTFTAVTYQRVSTKEQAAKGGRDEGFSIPAQREANSRKAEALGARVVAEFVDAGESARSADRPDLKRMLDYITSHQVTYCIVHKVDRLARNRLDDVHIHQALLAAGVTLVSATENIDETPSGMLLHGIMSSIAEFYSKNLATEVTKGLAQKIATGGTPCAHHSDTSTSGHWTSTAANTAPSKSTKNAHPSSGERSNSTPPATTPSWNSSPTQQHEGSPRSRHHNDHPGRSGGRRSSRSSATPTTSASSPTKASTTPAATNPSSTWPPGSASSPSSTLRRKPEHASASTTTI